LKSSPLWRYVKKLHLQINKLVQILQNPFADRFSKQLLYTGVEEVAVYENTG
jgi:hypothetical protein